MQFLRLSSILADRGWTVELVDYIDGTMARNLNDSRVKVLAYSDDGQVTISPLATLVLQTMTPWSIFPGIKVSAQTKVLFWTCHPFNLVPSVPVLNKVIQHGPKMGRWIIPVLLPRYWKNSKRLLRELLLRQSIIFMDFGTAKNTGAYLLERISTPHYVPVPAPALPQTMRPSAPSAGTEFNIGWVGRIADFKYPILAFTLQRLNQIAGKIDRQIIIKIIGSGDFLPNLVSDAKRCENLRVEFLGEKTPEDVLTFLKTEVDLLLAMGTSALEGAACGVPTILLDFTYGSVPSGYRYQWLHEAKGYSLGELIDSSHICNEDDGLTQKIRKAITNGGDLGADMRHYVDRAHSIERVAELLEESIRKANATWGELESMGLFKVGPIYRIYKAVQPAVLGLKNIFANKR